MCNRIVAPPAETLRHGPANNANLSHLVTDYARRALAACVAGAGLLLGSSQVLADAIPSSPTIRHTGNFNYVATGGSLRTQSNSGNYCTVGSSSNSAVSGIPAGASIEAAYLYWGGSGNSIDSAVTLNGNTVTAGRTFTETSGGNAFFGGFANVTSLVSGNGTFTFSGLSVTTSDPYCSAANVMAGWALVVVYESSTEPLRAINIFDGLEAFYSSALSLSPTGFRIPATGIDGKMTAITWEGDPNNSGTVGGFSESLSFNGSTLDDNAVPAGSSPTVQQYDGTVTDQGSVISTTSYGADIDTYNVSSLLSPGQTSATTYYSAGGDRVFLAAQIISVTSEPQVDLSITKSHSGSFNVGSNATYTLQVANAAGMQQVDYLTTVTDTLPTGLTYVSATGTGWTCSAVGQDVTCTHPSPLAAGSAFPDITLTVLVGNAAYPSVSNTATVTTAGSNDFTPGNNSATDVATVNGSNLSSSTKTVSDLNGGEANPGDTLRYTITLINTTSVTATGVSVTDDVPTNVSSFTVPTVPAGASNGSTGSGTGSNNTGYLNISNITVPANGNVTVVFDVVVATGTSPGATIDNTATVTNPTGPGATPSAPQVVVSPSQIPGSGTKQLYLWNNGTRSTALYRAPPSGSHTSVTMNGNGGTSTWTLTPALQKALTLNSGGFQVRLYLARSGSGLTNGRTVTVTLSNSVLGTLASTSNSVPATAGVVIFNLSLGSAVTAPVGSTFALTVTNTTGTTNRTVTLSPYVGSNFSLINLNSATVINVDSVQPYNAAYSGGVVTTSFIRGNTVYLRSVVSDPFGSFDITAANLTLLDPSGSAVLSNVAMTQVADSGAATKTYQYAYAIPANASAGVWTARVVANEGTEGTITDLGVGTFTVTIPMPTLNVSKVSSVVWDPVNLNSNPKRIPGSIVSYTITVSNSGTGSVDASSLVITDVVPDNTRLCVTNVAPCAVIQFNDGSPSSGLSYTSANSSYSSSVGGGAPFSYTPAAIADGTDAAVTGLRIAPTGSLAGKSTGSDPSFSITFRVKVK